MSNMIELRDTIFADIAIERARQEELRRQGKFDYTCASLFMSDDRKMTVLSEEVGEAAKEVVEIGIATDKQHRTGDPTWAQHAAAARVRLRKELIQSAAVIVAWLEALDAPHG